MFGRLDQNAIVSSAQGIAIEDVPLNAPPNSEAKDWEVVMPTRAEENGKRMDHPDDGSKR